MIKIASTLPIYAHMDQLLENIEAALIWLEGTDGEETWEDHVAILTEDVRRIDRIKDGIRRDDKTGTRSAEGPQHDPYTRKAAEVSPVIHTMIGAMRKHNKERALQSGTSARDTLRA